MFRVKLAMIVGGGFLAFFGGQEFLVSSGSGSDPVAVELAAVESGTEPESNYVAIGEHIALYGGCVYTKSTHVHIELLYEYPDPDKKKNCYQADAYSRFKRFRLAPN